MKRRTFIKNTAASTALLSMGGLTLSCTEQKPTKITILHTNDVHSHIDPFGPNDGRNANKGGVARRATLIQKLRQKTPTLCCWMLVIFFKAPPILTTTEGN